MTYAIDQSHSSPNHSPRFGALIRCLVLHATVGGAESSLNWLCSPSSRVSSHYVITKTGAIYQLVPDDQAAWHAGVSFWRGMGSEQIQLSSLGIELENANTGHDPYPQAQLDSCALLCRSKIAAYHIARAYVVRHLDIAIPAGRKTDPAGMAWPGFADRLFDLVPVPLPPTRYKVRASVTAGAIIRSSPHVNGRILGRLRAGDAWQGDKAIGDTVALEGFQTGNTWIVDARDGRSVWASLLEEVR